MFTQGSHSRRDIDDFSGSILLLAGTQEELIQMERRFPQYFKTQHARDHMYIVNIDNRDHPDMVADVGSVEQMAQLPDERFEVVCFSNISHDVNFVNAIQIAARVMQDDGVLVLSTVGSVKDDHTFNPTIQRVDLYDESESDSDDDEPKEKMEQKPEKRSFIDFAKIFEEAGFVQYVEMPEPISGTTKGLNGGRWIASKSMELDLKKKCEEIELLEVIARSGLDLTTQEMTKHFDDNKKQFTEQVRASASSDRKNKQGKTALEAAIKNREPQMLAMLLNGIAKKPMQFRAKYETQAVELLYIEAMRDPVDEKMTTLLTKFILNSFSEKYQQGSADRDRLIIELVKRGDFKTPELLMEGGGEDVIVKKFLELLPEKTMEQDVMRAVDAVLEKSNMPAITAFLNKLNIVNDKNIVSILMTFGRAIEEKTATAEQAQVIFEKITPYINSPEKKLKLDSSPLKDALLAMQQCIRKAIKKDNRDIMEIFSKFSYPEMLVTRVETMMKRDEFGKTPQEMKEIVMKIRKCAPKAEPSSSPAFFHDQSLGQQVADSHATPVSGRTLDHK